jgi:hypothetical protein
LPEIERRWLADLGEIGSLDGMARRMIDDLYIEGTRLRLRRVVEPNGERIFKLGKKYGKRSPRVEPITTLNLTEAEYTRLAILPGRRVSKQRLVLASGSLDLYPRHEPDPLAIFEVEFPNEAAAELYRPPPFVTREVTGDPAYSGYTLALRTHQGRDFDGRDRGDRADG